MTLLPRSAEDRELHRLDLATAPPQALVDAFTVAAPLKAHYDARSRVERSNYYVGVLWDLYKALKQRGPDAQRLLLPLLEHADPTTRLHAATFALDFAPAQASDALKRMMGHRPEPGAFHANPADILKAWQNQQLRFDDHTADQGVPDDAPEAEVVPASAPVDDALPGALIRRFGLADHTDKLEALLRLGIWLRRRPVNEAELPVGRSKFGGHPDLPPGLEWPERRGERLAFLAQINLAELADLNHCGDLPDAGMLYFFWDADACPGVYSSDSRDAGAVLFYEQNQGLIRAERPSDLVPNLLFPAAGVDGAAGWLLPGALRWSGELDHWEELDDWDDEDEEDDEDDEDDADAPAGEVGERYDAMLDELNATLFGDRDSAVPLPPQHVLLGHPASDQDDLAPACVELSREPSAEEEWRLLLQVDSDASGTRWMFGDGGRVCFMIREADLAAQRFDRVVILAQCG